MPGVAHDPGPWKWLGLRDSETWDGVIVRDIPPLPEHPKVQYQVIAALPAVKPEAPAFPASRANARLIQAAPALLVAARTAQYVLQDMLHHAEFDPDDADWALQLIRGAVAIYEGVQLAAPAGPGEVGNG